MIHSFNANGQQDRENAILCERLKASDRRAFSALFQEMNEALLRYAWRITKEEAAAQDVVQDAFLKLWQARAGLDQNRSVRGLLYTMTRNQALNHNRALSQENVSLDTMIDVGIEGEVLQDTEMDAAALEENLRRWVSGMPERRREAFELSRFEGLNHEEIAEIMGLSPSTVNRHIVMALQTLREKLHTFAPEWNQEYASIDTTK